LKVKKALFLLPLMVFLASCATNPVITQNQKALSRLNGVVKATESSGAMFPNIANLLYSTEIADKNVSYNYSVSFKHMPFLFNIENYARNLKISDVIDVNNQAVVANCTYGNIGFRISFPIIDFIYFSNLPDCQPTMLKQKAGVIHDYVDPRSHQLLDIYSTNWSKVSDLLNECKDARNPLTNKNFVYFKSIIADKSNKNINAFLINLVMFGYASNISDIKAPKDILQKIDLLKNSVNKIYILQNPTTAVFTKAYVVEPTDATKTFLAILAVDNVNRGDK
jgi:hypothetical protein